ncbi:hypothetical protein FB384_002158 [Prauserella sediminis]|uniref:Uncharacterized protein n=1 Tax=Prauserella sediminis TaxID=577680 RepID=A0A839XP36_9PSEU|nr:hypothetical protein [Prauserella sediminis]
MRSGGAIRGRGAIRRRGTVRRRRRPGIPGGRDSTSAPWKARHADIETAGHRIRGPRAARSEPVDAVRHIAPRRYCTNRSKNDCTKSDRIKT